MDPKSGQKYKKAFKAFTEALLGNPMPQALRDEVVVTEEKTTGGREVEPKGQYEHFSVFEDFKFIDCLNQFKNTTGFRTRQGYFEKLSSEFGRTLCSIRRRWERLNVLTPSQKELVVAYFEKFPNCAAQRRIVFAKNCTNVSLLTMDGRSSIPDEELALFKRLKTEFLQIEPSVESDSKYNDELLELPEREENNALIETLPQQSSKSISLPAEPVVPTEISAPAPVALQENNDEVSSSESIVLDISGNEEDLHRLQKIKRRPETEGDGQLFWSRRQKGLSDCHSSISDVIEDAMESQYKEPLIGQKREQNFHAQDPQPQNGRKKQKLDVMDQSTNLLKQKITNFKEALTQDEAFIPEKAELLENVLIHFSKQYECDLKVIQDMIQENDTLNMEELKFKLCMRFLNNRLNSEKGV